VGLEALAPFARLRAPLAAEQTHGCHISRLLHGLARTLIPRLAGAPADPRANQQRI
jgi:hypothetical protein